MSSTTLYLGDVARVQGQKMTVISGRTLDIVDAPTSDQNAANKAYVDLKAKEVQDALNSVTAGSEENYDTLIELKKLADEFRDTGASSLITSISTEKNRAEGAEGKLTSDLTSEATAARNAELILRNDLTSEATAARNAELILRTDLASEDARATAAELRLQTMNVLSSTTMLYVPAIYADSSTLPTPLERCSYAATTNSSIFDGWRMRNAVTGNKFNFYLPLISGTKVTVTNPSLTANPTGASTTLSTTGLKVKDIKAMYLETCIISAVSMPFITFYTVPKKDGNDQSWWYRSRHTFINNNTGVADTNYNMVANLKNITNIKSSNFLKQQNLTLDMFSSKKTDITTDEDDILSFAVSSDSSSSAGNVECIIGKFNIQFDTGIHEFVFSNTHVFADYMKRKQSQLWNSMYGSSSTDDPFINDLQIPAKTYS